MPQIKEIFFKNRIRPEYTDCSGCCNWDINVIMSVDNSFITINKGFIRYIDNWMKLSFNMLFETHLIIVDYIVELNVDDLRRK